LTANSGGQLTYEKSNVGLALKWALSLDLQRLLGEPHSYDQGNCTRLLYGPQ